MKIRRMSDVVKDPKPRFTCERCGNELKQPIEQNAVYISPNGKDAFLVCPKCLKRTDFYIWGNAEVRER